MIGFLIWVAYSLPQEVIVSLSTKCRLQTADRVQNADQVQNADCGQQTEYKMQTDKKNVSTFDFITYLLVVSIIVSRGDCY